MEISGIHFEFLAQPDAPKVTGSFHRLPENTLDGEERRYCTLPLAIPVAS